MTRFARHILKGTDVPCFPTSHFAHYVRGKSTKTHLYVRDEKAECHSIIIPSVGALPLPLNALHFVSGLRCAWHLQSRLSFGGCLSEDIIINHLRDECCLGDATKMSLGEIK
jgi:hypothetical protein